mgnify:CR=1 FL=1
MHDELTAVDMQKMREELREREEVLMPKILEDVKVARSFGDLSENFEYKAAKAEQRKNMSRIRYLKQMLASAVVIDAKSGADEVGLFDRVVLYLEDDDEEMTVRFVTTLRQNALEGLISKESPLGADRPQGRRARIRPRERRLRVLRRDPVHRKRSGRRKS